jgi:hypothetical protein
MIELIQNILLFPWWVASTLFMYAFGLLVYVGIFEALRHYRPWEYFNIPTYHDLFSSKSDSVNKETHKK